MIRRDDAIGVAASAAAAVTPGSADRGVPPASGPQRGTPAHGSACSYITRAEIAELFSAPVGPPIEEHDEGTASCAYPNGAADRYSHADIEIVWRHGGPSSLEQQLSEAFADTEMGRAPGSGANRPGTGRARAPRSRPLSHTWVINGYDHECLLQVKTVIDSYVDVTNSRPLGDDHHRLTQKRRLCQSDLRAPARIAASNSFGSDHHNIGVRMMKCLSCHDLPAPLRHAATLIVLAAVAGCGSSAKPPGAAAPPAATQANAAPEKNTVPRACEMVTAAEMTEILGVAVGAKDTTHSSGATECQYAAPSGFPTVDFAVNWGDGEIAMRAVSMVNAHEPGIASPYDGIGDQAAAVGPALMIRSGDDLVKLVFTGVEGAPAKAKKIFDTAKARM